MYRIFYFTVFVSIILFTSCKGQPVEIIRVDVLSYDTIQLVDNKPLPFKGEVYLVRGYKDNDMCNKLIDSFVYKNADTAFLAKGSSYIIEFYKESSETNLKNINFLKWRVIDRYSQDHDAISRYRLSFGKYTIEKFRNGSVYDYEGKENFKVIIEEK
jgi:hypothetical protein